MTPQPSAPAAAPAPPRPVTAAEIAATLPTDPGTLALARAVFGPVLERRQQERAAQEHGGESAA